ncbi:uncharacterized protein LOC135150159 [Daucus carota subsp. sativus]|uniref:uncharacterized protein LOC135150159 n=1 Tax=Daucus carota subsp. sativus TaxID=79200 RepID=UPI003083C8F2
MTQKQLKHKLKEVKSDDKNKEPRKNRIGKIGIDKSNNYMPTKSDIPVNSDAPNSDVPVNTEAASPPKQKKRRRLVAAYDFDDLEPAQDVNSEPTPTTTNEPAQSSPQQKPARFKRRAHKPKRAKIPESEITDFTIQEEQTPSSPIPVDPSQALMVEPLQAVPITDATPLSPTTSPKATSTASASEAPEKSAQDNVEKVADPVPADEKANSDTEDDTSSDTDKDENAETSKSIDSLRTEVAKVKETNDLEKKRTINPMKENVQKLIKHVILELSGSMRTPIRTSI